jgi:FAD synthase
VLGFTGNLYRRKAMVELLRRIRSIERFKNDEALRRAISRDVEIVGKE